MTFVCSDCGRPYPGSEPLWRCPTCRGTLELRGEPDIEPVSMGEGETPLVELDGLYLKLEGLNPTGSFKDRGTALLVGWMKQIGIGRCLDDSSGNAGASLAGYCARAGIACRLYVPAAASGPKRRQIEAYGAELVPIEGTRPQVSQAAQAAARNGVFYASHAHHPLIQAGMAGFAREVARLAGWRELPLYYPVGQGTLLLGSHRGFRELGGSPPLHAVQAQACAPLAGLPVSGETRAEGIRVVHPVRKAAVLEAIRESGGSVITVGEMEIERAHQRLARQGFYVEPTSAVAYAGWLRAGQPRPALIPLTGTGLKS